MKLLLIEDDKKLSYSLKEALKEDYIVELAHSGIEGKYANDVYEYDLIVLDLGLPDIEGISLCKDLRKRRVKTPILVLTGVSEIRKKVLALDSGADDYVTKPFNFPELEARIRALLRRHVHNITENIVTVEDLHLDPMKKTVKRGEIDIHLQRKEFQILEYFMRNVGVLITRDMILQHVWKSEFEAVTNVVDVHIKYLRDKIDKQFGKKLIKTIYGVGYKMET